VSVLDEIRSWNKKPKELVAFLSARIERDPKLLPDLVKALKEGTDSEKGTCADVLKHVAMKNSRSLLPFLKEIISFVDYKAPRVKWGTSEAIAFVAKDFPGKADSAIPKLLVNAGDAGTVNRWSAAFALAEIARTSAGARKVLIPKFRVLEKKEESNGVKKIFSKVLKEFPSG
jgi:hypothetical protein